MINDLLKLDLSGILSDTQISEDIEEISNKDIAIIGIGARLPQAEHIEKFWENIRNGIDCTGDFPENRKRDIERYLYNTAGPEKKEIQYQKCSYLEEIDKFDYDFFKLTPMEANLMNPIQRIFLETAWKSIEDAGYGGNALKGSNTGVYVGFIGDLEGYKYKQLISAFESKDSSAVSMAGNLSAIIPSRISYLLDLKGPSMLVDTACSSSLVAIHLACQAIRNGDCEQAVAGGIRISFMPVDDEIKIGMESPDATTRTFDENSNGTSLGEGVVSLFLKPLYRAKQDRDNIYAVIKGSAVNQDGTSMGITSPNALAQAEVIKKSWKNAGINPETISYIEAHGTGTKLGDPIEIEGIKLAFEAFTNKKQFCAIGSVKTNIGHLFEAAGIAGLLKVILALNKKEIPPTNHFSTPNKKIGFEDSPVYVNDKPSKWESGETPRRCGVSSFGFSGTNCHVVLEEAPETVGNDNTSQEEKFEFLALSAKRKEGIGEVLESYRSLLSKENSLKLKDLCYTANTGRGHYSHRLVILANKKEDLIEKIHYLCTRGVDAELEGVFYGEHRILPARKENPEKHEITAGMKNELDAEAKVKISDILSSNYANDDLVKKICLLYVRGADVEWEKLYTNAPVKKVSLPTYPFDKQKCWVRLSKGNSGERMAYSSYFNNLVTEIENYLTTKNDESKRIEEGLVDIEKYGQMLLLKELIENGIFANGEQEEKNHIKKKLGVISKYERFYEAVIHILMNAGLVSVNEDGILYPNADPAQLDSEFLHGLRAKIETCYGDKKAYLELLETCITHLKAILSGDLPATSVIFPNSSTSLVENIYKNNKNADFFNDLVALSIRSYIELQQLSNGKSSEKIKIVEIGAGTGGTSDSVIHHIKGFANGIEYNYTDISKGFTEYGKNKYGANNSWIKFKELNIEKPIESQGFSKNHYDIIMASNVIHATSNIKNTLKEVNKLLKTNGILILNEITKVHDFTTLTFGLLDGWWLFEDSDLRIADSPLLNQSSWEEVLNKCGFKNVRAFNMAQSDGSDGSISLIVAEKFENVEAAKNTHAVSTIEVETHGLLGKCNAVSMFSDIYTTLLNPGKDWILSEHVVAGRYIVPGTAYLEMAQKAGRAYYKSQGVELRDVVLVKPLILRKDENREVHTIIKKNKESIEFVIASKLEDKNGEAVWTEHASGRMYKLLERAGKDVDVKAFMSGYMEEEVHVDPNQYTKEFIQFGPRWMNCAKQLDNDKATLAIIELPDSYVGDLKDFDLHPALLDMAFNAKSFKLGSKYLPMAYTSIKVYGRLPQKFYSYIVKKNEDGEGENTIDFDVLIADENGTKIVEVEGYSIRKINNIEAVLGDDSLFSAVKWIEKPLEQSECNYTGKTILVLKSDEAIGCGIINALESYGNQVIHCTPGFEYSQIDKNQFVFTGDQDGYAKLAKDIDFNSLDAVIHLQSITGGKDIVQLEELDGQLEKGVKSFFYLSQQLISHKKNGNLDIWVIADYGNQITDGDEKVCPWNASLFGLARSMSKEYQNFCLKCIDIDNKTSSEEILSEIKTQDGFTNIAYRNGIRYVDEIDLLDLNILPEHPFQLKDTGVYIITGGTGGIGIEISKYLSSKSRVNLALINRSKVPDRCQWDKLIENSGDGKLCRIIKSILEIEASGSKVELISADITNLTEMKSVLEGLRKQYHSINGIIHSAGVFGKGLLYTKEWSDFERVLKPKVHGAWILDYLTRSDELDFFILFSSAVSIFDVAGQTDYVAANAFLDSFSALMQKHIKYVISINWPAWKEVGMAFDEGVNVSTILEAISTDKAIYGFDRVIRKELNQVLIGDWNYSDDIFEQISSRVSQSIKRKIEQGRENSENHSNENSTAHTMTLKGRANEDYTKTECLVAKVWGEVLGFESINIYDDLYKLGCDSILAMKIVNNLNKDLPEPVNISDVFNNPTIFDFARDYDEKQASGKKTDVEIVKDYAKVEESLLSSNKLDIEPPKMDDGDFDF